MIGRCAIQGVGAHFRVPPVGDPELLKADLDLQAVCRFEAGSLMPKCLCGSILHCRDTLQNLLQYTDRQHPHLLGKGAREDRVEDQWLAAGLGCACLVNCLLCDPARRVLRLLQWCPEKTMPCSRPVDGSITQARWAPEATFSSTHKAVCTPGSFRHPTSLSDCHFLTPQSFSGGAHPKTPELS